MKDERCGLCNFYRGSGERNLLQDASGEILRKELLNLMADLALKQDTKMHRGFLSDDEHLALTPIFYKVAPRMEKQH